MPSGFDKNFVRLCGAVEGFRSRYGVWPRKVRLFPGALEDLENSVFSDEMFGKLKAKLELVPDDAPIVAEDDEGRQYSYGKAGFPESKPAEWLGVVPDGPGKHEG